MSHIISADRFQRLAVPLDILPLIDRDHRGASMLIHMCRRHPLVYGRDDLMKVGGFSESVQGAICAYTAFEWTILRINDRLPRTGWRINGSYRLEMISDEQAAWLTRRLNGVAA